MKRNLVLCGFMGCGKSTLGALLAEHYGARFVDVDTYIEQTQGMSIPELFARYTEQGFRDREHQAIVALAAGENQVLSTGGGALTVPRNLPPLQKNGVILFLNPGFEACWQRICHSDRPLVRANNREALEALYRQREVLYRQAADLEVTCQGTPRQCLDEVLGMLGSFL